MVGGTHKSKPVLLDSTVLSNLGHVGRPDLVFLLWPNLVCTTGESLQEYEAGAKRELLHPDLWSRLPIVSLTDDELSLSSSLGHRLGAGERSCIAVAAHRNGLFASDDRDSRVEASSRGVPLTGTLGILVASLRRGHLSLEQGNALLSGMVKDGYRSASSASIP